MEIKDFRFEIDKFINSIPLLQPSGEVILSKRALQRSFSWLGEALKESGSQTPYKESDNSKSPVIEPTADHVADNTLQIFFNDTDGTQTAKVKRMRGIIESVLVPLKVFRSETANSLGEFDTCVEKSYWDLKEAKHWLGWELARIRDEEKSK